VLEGGGYGGKLAIVAVCVKVWGKRKGKVRVMLRPVCAGYTTIGALTRGASVLAVCLASVWGWGGAAHPHPLRTQGTPPAPRPIGGLSPLGEGEGRSGFGGKSSAQSRSVDHGTICPGRLDMQTLPPLQSHVPAAAAAAAAGAAAALAGGPTKGADAAAAAARAQEEWEVGHEVALAAAGSGHGRRILACVLCAVWTRQGS